MRHYVQYHNTDRLEKRPPNPRSEGFRVWSSKSQKELGGCIGQTVWLISGEKQSRSKRYFLEYAFVVQSIESGKVEGFTSMIFGAQGHLFDPRISVDVLPWFNDLRAERNNFGYGFGQVKSAKIIKGMEAAKEGAGLRMGFLPGNYP